MKSSGSAGAFCAALEGVSCEAGEYCAEPVLKTMEACERKGIPVLRFYTDFQNDAAYVCGRIRSVLVK